jgi:hypothetical protein
LPKGDIEALWPEFYSASDEQKGAFWVLLVASITRLESSFDPRARLLEGGNMNYYSEGLMQLSYVDKETYKSLPINKASQNIFDPKNNLQSGVIILASQLERLHVLFAPNKLYWQVLMKSKPQIIKFFKASGSGLKK